MNELREVHLSSIVAPEAPLRLAIERGGIEELAESIRQVGLLQPLVVRACDHGYEVIAGHRRLLALRLAGVDRCAIRVLDGDHELARVAMLAENVMRLDLSPVEEARAVSGMRELMGLSVTEIARRMAKSEAWVRGRLELLAWPPAALAAVAEGRASVAALRPLVEIESEVERDRLIGCAVDSGATAEVTRQWAAAVAGEAAQCPENLSSRSQAALPMAEYVVSIPCWCCRELLLALDLRIVRLCDPCIELLQAGPAALSNAGAAQ